MYLLDTIYELLYQIIYHWEIDFTILEIFSLVFINVAIIKPKLKEIALFIKDSIKPDIFLYFSIFSSNFLSIKITTNFKKW